MKGERMKYEDAVKIAEDFCAKSEFRKNLAAPRYDHRCVYATNGIVAVRIAVDHDGWLTGDEIERKAKRDKFPFERIDCLLNGGEVLKAGMFDAGRIEEIAKDFLGELVEWRIREASIRDRERIDAEVECPHCRKSFYVEGGQVVDEKHFEVDNDDFEYRVAVKFGEEWDLFNFAWLRTLFLVCGEDCRVEVLPEHRRSDERGASVRMGSRDGQIDAIIIGCRRPAIAGAEPKKYGARDVLEILNEAAV